MKITTKDGLTLELPDNAEVQIDGDKITVKPSQPPCPNQWCGPFVTYPWTVGSAPAGVTTTSVPLGEGKIFFTGGLVTGMQ